MAELFKALGDENRLRILNLLSEFRLCVCEIEMVLNLSQSNVSRHLSKLKNIGIISGDKDGQWIHYEISDKFLSENELLYKYLKEVTFKDGNYQEDYRVCKEYVDSPYDCQTITNKKEFMMKFLHDK
jgi:ArsR family transcriptional regulator